MQDTLHIFEQSLANKSRQAWLNAVEDIADEVGHFQPLSAKHSAALFNNAAEDGSDGGKTLLVTFETLKSIEAISKDVHPIGFNMIQNTDCALLSFFSDGNTWFRDPAVYRYFDTLIDEEFFENFERVVFYGSNSAGYAACAFSVASPGAHVLALSPQATLDPRVTEWDRRARAYRRMNFNDRFGFAPYMLDAAERATIIYDPYVELDAVHSALFERANVDRLRMKYFGSALNQMMMRLDILHPLLKTVIEGGDVPSTFHTLHRKRRENRFYLRTLLERAERAHKWDRALRICDHATHFMDAPRFRKRAEQIVDLQAKQAEALANQGDTKGQE